MPAANANLDIQGEIFQFKGTQTAPADYGRKASGMASTVTAVGTGHLDFA